MSNIEEGVVARSWYTEMHRRAQRAESEIARLRRENERLTKYIDLIEGQLAYWGKRKSLPLEGE